QGRHVRAARRGGRELPGLGDRPRHSTRSRRARDRRAALARRGVSLTTRVFSTGAASGMMHTRTAPGRSTRMFVTAVVVRALAFALLAVVLPLALAQS